jgi:acyl CoA:acetate/3-ketoacid CoA transferase
MTAGVKVNLDDGRLTIIQEGKVKKFVPQVEHVTFSGKMARQRGQNVMFVTERCVMRLEPDGLTVTEIAPGVDLERDVLAQADLSLRVSDQVREMDQRLFRPEPMGLTLESER